MNWTRIYHRIPPWAQNALIGLPLAILFAAGPTLLVRWLRLWS